MKRKFLSQHSHLPRIFTHPLARLLFSQSRSGNTQKSFYAKHIMKYFAQSDKPTTMQDSSHIPFPIRVMLVDDHKVVCSGLAALLHAYDEFELVAEAADGTAAIRLCESARPDVILMDLMMPRMDGATATRYIRERYPNIRILILTNFKEDHLVYGALKAGAMGYLLKNVTPDELANAIRSAYRERVTLAPEAAEALIHASFHHDSPPLGYDLTGREREVLDLMAKGLDNKRIAETLIVSNSTVKFHVSNILSKLHKVNRTEAVVVALQNHLISPRR